MNIPSYFRARLEALHHYASQGGDNVVLLRNGFVPDALKKEFEINLKNREVKDERQLQFDEVTRFNTWFAMHPEKVCGIETVTTSIQFPITIKGNITSAVKQIRELLKGASSNKRLALVQAKAKALKLKLQMSETLEGVSAIFFKTKKQLIIK